MASSGDPTTVPDGISPAMVEVISLGSVFTALSTLSVALRFASRRVARSTSYDDWVSLGSLVFACGYLAILPIEALLAHAGWEDEGVYTPKQRETLLKTILPACLTYLFSITLSKLAVLLFYCRIFPIKRFKTRCRIFMAIVAAYWLAGTFCFIFTSYPVQTQWRYWEPHQSINQQVFWWVGGVINTLIDVAILCLPHDLIWKLQLPARRKALLSVLLLLGLFTSVTSIARVVALSRLDFDELEWSLRSSIRWQILEINLSIICSCAPTFHYLFKHWRKQGGVSNRDSQEHSKPTESDSFIDDSVDLEAGAAEDNEDRGEVTEPERALHPRWAGVWWRDDTVHDESVGVGQAREK